MRTLPQDVTEEAFASAVAQMKVAVGDQNVFLDDLAVSAYRDPYSPTPDGTFVASAAVAPATVEQIQAILKIVNDHRIPLWTISTGRNLGYGGPAPRKSGSVVLDLKRMNRVIEVNEKYGYAIVEPGVSYFQLYRHLQSIGSKLWVDTAAPGWGGVMGNALERGFGYTPYGDHSGMQCGMEVVLADGTVVRTGQGALPGSSAWQIGKYALGPSVDGIFTQSNFGIVTKMGIWLMSEPPGYRPFMATFQREDDIEQIINALRPAKLSLTFANVAVIANVIWEASVKSSRRQYYTGDGPIPPSILSKIAADHDIGAWNLYGALYGPPPMMENDWKFIEGAIRSVPGARIYFDRPGDPAWKYRTQLMRGVPNMTEFSLMNWVGAGGHMSFSPFFPVDGKIALTQFRQMQSFCHQHGFDYVGEFGIAWRAMAHVLELLYERTDDDQRERSRKLFGELVAEAAKKGFGEYRGHLEFMDQIAGAYSFNDNSLWKLHHQLKDALDPNGILSPGKQGIWPASMRDGRTSKAIPD